MNCEERSKNHHKYRSKMGKTVHFCSKKLIKILGMIKRNFVDKSKETLVVLCLKKQL